MKITECLKEAALAAMGVNDRFPIGFTRSEIICTERGIVVNCCCHIRPGEGGFGAARIAGHLVVPYDTVDYCHINLVMNALEEIEAQTLSQVKKYIGA